MRDSDPTLHLVKQMMQARQREAAVEAMRARHSRSGLLSNFLRRLTGLTPAAWTGESFLRA